MVLFNYSTKELTAKVVYYGPGLCGKTTNLQWIHEKLPIKNKGKMLSLATETDRTLFFDFLPIELGTIRGMKTRIQLYTVPGQVFYNATRRMVLKGADCVVFVADSQDAMLEANAESLENLKENLEVNDISLDDIPLVIQYNKRDLPNALPVDQMNARLNPRGVPHYEAVAVKGVGVEETLKGVTSLVFKSLATRYGGPEGKAAASKTTVPAPNVVAPTASPPARIPPPPPAPPPSAPPPAPPPAPARATGAFSPSDLLEADPVEVAPEEVELDLEPAGEPVEELSLDELGVEPEAPPAEEPFDLDLELEEEASRAPMETVEDFSPLSELEGFDPPPSHGTRTQPSPSADDPLAGLGGDTAPGPGGATTPLGGDAFDPSSLGGAEETLDPGMLPEDPPAPAGGSGWDPSALSAPEPEPEPPPLAAPPAPSGWDPSALSAPEADAELELDGLDGLGDAPAPDAGDEQELQFDDLFDAPSAAEAPPLPEPEPEAPPLPEAEPEPPPLPEPEPDDDAFELSMDEADDDPLAGLDMGVSDLEEEPFAPTTAPVPRFQDDDDAPVAQPTMPMMAVEDDDPLAGFGDDPFGEPEPQAPPLPEEEPEPVGLAEPDLPEAPSFGSDDIEIPEPDSFGSDELGMPEPDSFGSDDIEIPEPDSFGSDELEPPSFEAPEPEPPLIARQPEPEAPPLPEPEPPPPPQPPPPRRQQQPVAVPLSTPERPRPAPSSPRPEPAMAAPQTSFASDAAVATATVERAITPSVGTVALAGGGAENDITIPVEVTLGPGGATQVNLNIRLTLNFKLQ